MLFAPDGRRSQLIRDCIYAAYFIEDHDLLSVLQPHWDPAAAAAAVSDVGTASMLMELADAKGLLLIEIWPDDHAMPDMSIVLLLMALRSKIIREVFVPALSRGHSITSGTICASSN